MKKEIYNWNIGLFLHWFGLLIINVRLIMSILNWLLNRVAMTAKNMFNLNKTS